MGGAWREGELEDAGALHDHQQLAGPRLTSSLVSAAQLGWIWWSNSWARGGRVQEQRQKCPSESGAGDAAWFASAPAHVAWAGLRLMELRQVSNRTLAAPLLAL